MTRWPFLRSQSQECSDCRCLCFRNSCSVVWCIWEPLWLDLWPWNLWRNSTVPVTTRIVSVLLKVESVAEWSLHWWLQHGTWERKHLYARPIHLGLKLNENSKPVSLQFWLRKTFNFATSTVAKQQDWPEYLQCGSSRKEGPPVGQARWVGKFIESSAGIAHQKPRHWTDLSYTNYWYYCKSIQIFGESNGELHITAWHTLTHHARWAWSFGLTLGFRMRNAVYKVMNLRGKFELDECRASRPTNIFAPPSAIILERTSPPTPIEKNWATEEQKGTMGSHFRPARSQLDFPEFWLPEPWVGNTNHGLLHRTGVQLRFIPSSAQKFDSTQVGKHITLWSGWLLKEASALDTASALHCISNMNTAWSCFYKADWSM